eukprot:TRINITY_DN1825_c0_g1_i1.p1 TRINITY_DN1825_c0_g1~~TRINITY_DN1825_c0_g1_i1.p1  ORF type:complete len:875 (-),score=199.92 TRINITY_DN1825_c0_g1_i1:145-2736(-)
MRGVLGGLSKRKGSVDLSGKGAQDGDIEEYFQEKQDRLESIVDLDLSGNEFTKLPENLHTLVPSLRVLSLNKNKLAILPTNFTSKSLTKISLSHNHLKEFPPMIFTCENLLKLNVSHNELTSLSPLFSNFTNLESLDASHNCLISVSPRLSLISESLAYLSLDHNPLLSPYLLDTPKARDILGVLSRMRYINAWGSLQCNVRSLTNHEQFLKVLPAVFQERLSKEQQEISFRLQTSFATFQTQNDPPYMEDRFTSIPRVPLHEVLSKSNSSYPTFIPPLWDNKSKLHKESKALHKAHNEEKLKSGKVLMKEAKMKRKELDEMQKIKHSRDSPGHLRVAVADHCAATPTWYHIELRRHFPLHVDTSNYPPQANTPPSPPSPSPDDKKRSRRSDRKKRSPVKNSSKPGSELTPVSTDDNSPRSEAASSPRSVSTEASGDSVDSNSKDKDPGAEGENGRSVDSSDDLEETSNDGVNQRDKEEASETGEEKENGPDNRKVAEETGQGKTKVEVAGKGKVGEGEGNKGSKRSSMRVGRGKKSQSFRFDVQVATEVPPVSARRSLSGSAASRSADSPSSTATLETPVQTLEGQSPRGGSRTRKLPKSKEVSLSGKKSSASLVDSRGGEERSPVRLKGNETVSFFAVYDGHAGHHVSDYLEHNMHVHFFNQRKLIQAGQIEKALTKAFSLSEEQLTSEMQMRSLTGGATAVVSVLVDNLIVTGWVGDSRAVLCRGGKAVELTVDHSPSLPKEKERIEAAGGTIKEDEDTGFIPRVNGALAMSRSFGDFEMKKVGVIAEPEFTSHYLTPEDEFILLASDGVFDTLNSQQAVDFIRREPFPSLAAERICVESRKESFDNITATIIWLNWTLR